ncbi:SOS response-associated peptidase [Aestuariicella hydrocarbonica]|uniref:Abasic site processing protein n=1 Tax=Pseudomaricurvus hydrocarbonicus TaxID=1470433 RepID=A0A9E5T1R4_9GAMM|nr:SOS response-associated peptidase [Aestuariicella hydrocarbonica]NHO67036.1 SOS response-associated peptidase [Aestuariicella hydrocarbonica]
MCGRFNISMTPGLVQLLDELGVPIVLREQYNIAPTESVPIFYEIDGERSCHPARWWLTPSWSSGPDTRFSMFNARAETLESSRAFKGPFHHKRCVIPCSSFLEWQKTPDGKQPIELYREDGAIALAGLWDCWNEELLSCALVTTAADECLKAIHHRMPVMLDSAGINLWLDTSQPLEDLQPLLAPRLRYTIAHRRVDPAINNSRSKVLPVPLPDA